MTWLITNNAREHYLAGINAAHPDNVPTLAEIAHSLAQINRFTGHCIRPYSVAEHSLLVADIMAEMGHDSMGQLCALMHDAHECITGDVASPVKDQLGEAWKTFEGMHQRALLAGFGLQEEYVWYHQAIKRADLIALATERRDLTLYDPLIHQPWPVIDTPGYVHAPMDYPLDSALRASTQWHEWAALFVSRANGLMADVARETPV